MQDVHMLSANAEPSRCWMAPEPFEVLGALLQGSIDRKPFRRAH
jgi:hypothetical protein